MHNTCQYTTITYCRRILCLSLWYVVTSALSAIIYGKSSNYDTQK